MNPDKIFISTLLFVFATMGETVCLGVPLYDNLGYKVVQLDQDQTYDYIDMTHEGVYAEHLKSLEVGMTGSPLSPPYIALSSSDSFEISFDDLHGGYENYVYRVLHCTHDWEISDLTTSEYLRGFNDQLINDIEQSFNTFQSYTHYRFSFPNEMCRPILSGNYVIQLFQEDDLERPLIIKRLVVYETMTGIRLKIKESTVVSERRYRQEVDFDVVKIDYPIYDAYDDMHVVVMQNHRWDNAVFGLQPTFNKGNEFVYDYSNENNFDGLNEFRWFDTKSLRYAALGTDSVRERADGWHHYLTPQPKRTYDVYRTQGDINGRYLLRNDDFDTAVESQYIWVHFTLATEKLSDADEIFIFGELTQWDYLDDAKMQWNSTRRCYEGKLYLKQGYYNYGYSVRYKGHPAGTMRELEGSHSVTRNSYTVIVYYADGRGYDRVIGMAVGEAFDQ